MKELTPVFLALTSLLVAQSNAVPLGNISEQDNTAVIEPIVAGNPFPCSCCSSALCPEHLSTSCACPCTCSCPTNLCNSCNSQPGQISCSCLQCSQLISPCGCFLCGNNDFPRRLRIVVADKHPLSHFKRQIKDRLTVEQNQCARIAKVLRAIEICGSVDQLEQLLKNLRNSCRFRDNHDISLLISKILRGIRDHRNKTPKLPLAESKVADECLNEGEVPQEISTPAVIVPVTHEVPEIPTTEHTCIVGTSEGVTPVTTTSEIPQVPCEELSSEVIDSSEEPVHCKELEYAESTDESIFDVMTVGPVDELPEIDEKVGTVGPLDDIAEETEMPEDVRTVSSLDEIPEISEEVETVGPSDEIPEITETEGIVGPLRSERPPAPKTCVVPEDVDDCDASEQISDDEVNDPISDLWAITAKTKDSENNDENYLVVEDPHNEDLAQPETVIPLFSLAD